MLLKQGNKHFTKGESEYMKNVLPQIPNIHFTQQGDSVDYAYKMRDVRFEEELEQILEYLKQDQKNCLYLFIDLSVYGLVNPNIHVWYDEDNQGTRMVVMQYHRSFQIYANRGFDDITGLMMLIERQKPFSISARQEIIQEIETKLPQYRAEHGVVIKGKDTPLEKLRHIINGSDVSISQAEPNDTYEIAQLICSDEKLGAPYTVESLAVELRERIETGMGRSFIIRDQGSIVAHMATYAECDTLSVASGLITAPQYRNTDYFFYLSSFVEYTLKKENKEIYGMILDKRLLKARIRMGWEVVAHYGILSLLSKSE